MKRKTKLAVEIVKNPQDEIPVKVLERAILDIAEGYKKILSSKIKQETLVVLLKDQTGLSKDSLRNVLNCLDNLRATWIKP